MGFFKCLLPKFRKHEDSKKECIDPEAIHLSYIGESAYEVLRTQHSEHHHRLWNVTLGSLVGPIHQTPNHLPFDFDMNHDEDTVDVIDPTLTNNHSNWFPERIGEILSRTQVWADVLSLAPPDGLFLQAFQEAIQTIAIRARKNQTIVTIRMMFGNIIGMPVNCHKLIKRLTALIPFECRDNMRIWVGAWRKGVSWNHAKIIAVDGIYLHTGGHNLWDNHYLKSNPVHDLSVEVRGPVAHDGHYFANDQWQFIKRAQSTLLGYIIDKLPDNSILPIHTHVIISEFPRGQATEFPPLYQRKLVKNVQKDLCSEPMDDEKLVPMITMGRYGSLLRHDRPSDDAIIALFQIAKTSIKLAIQDIGPVCIPSTKIALPGCVWPKNYLSELATAIWERNVQVDIVLSNPLSVPGSLSLLDACYGNGWSCNDVASEILKRIQKKYPITKTDEESKMLLQQKINHQLRICYLRRSKNHDKEWCTGRSLGLHSKHFIFDDRCAYIGSQNLYVCDLAEWGIVIDHQETVQKRIMTEYWKPLWTASYTGADLKPQLVIKGIDMNRDGETIYNKRLQLEYMKQSSVQLIGLGSGRDLQDHTKRRSVRTQKSCKLDSDDDGDDNFFEINE